jgi:hypothetical protein
VGTHAPLLCSSYTHLCKRGHLFITDMSIEERFGQWAKGLGLNYDRETQANEKNQVTINISGKERYS